jgi:hypothetical protein
MIPRILPRNDRYSGLVEITKGNRTFQMVGDPDVTLLLLVAHVAAVVQPEGK